ncbi:glycoside hydrolase family 3 protein [Sphingosinicella sp. BN140058]|uniref:glycoside hydrolase family 3 protein n=1 Tax=Sphingosinicella sp. BN140058 TaxID=1892855 RepID=UPI001012AD58|nr:glycoside hydrolase family 3 protein [Sphingosinicella sp. BN140058]QAY77468.1 glycoside hydrolase family 3 protein [Sphingosinicella sp. BN140058]
MGVSRLSLALLAVLALPASAGGAPKPAPAPGLLADWPAVKSPIGRDPVIERRIAGIVAGMTLEQKIGQMTQADVRYITPDEVRRYQLGSVLNGGGAWPAMNKHAGVRQWADLAAAFHTASMQTDAKVKIPLIWGTDAVHGHNNVFGATVFPHNIGLGAARDPALVEEIARATARAARATGISWVFAPTVAVAQDQRWGRTYESYSSDPALVRRYGEAAVRGLQGRLTGDGDVVASVKHFLADGGTQHGNDQGEARTSLAELINIHGAGYYGALAAGAQTVMASYSSWTDAGTGTAHGKMHGNRALLTDALKGRMGFDGFVVSDWNAIEQVPGCTKDHCPASINAGVDMVMVPEDWRAFIANTAADVKAGRIPMARIDDAVTRILRVKMRSGLFDRLPARSALNGRADALEARALARRAVQESLVLLKNDRGVLPLRRGGRLLVVGKSADSLSNQSGGWTRTWQGTENVNADFGTGETLLAALRETLGAETVVFSETGAEVDPADFSAVIAIVGETPYAEYIGDVDWPAPLHHSARYKEDLELLSKVAGRGAPVVTIFYSGRTVYANDLIDRSDAFVAAWLPGTEAGGIADLILRSETGGIRQDFRGTLPFAWPSDACATGPGAPILFQRGYGLRYDTPKEVPNLAVAAAPRTCAAG